MSKQEEGPEGPGEAPQAERRQGRDPQEERVAGLGNAWGKGTVLEPLGRSEGESIDPFTSTVQGSPCYPTVECTYVSQNDIK